jgi:chlorophyll(ide) b reductase
MKEQECGGAIFNLAGAGSDGNGSPLYGVYGATKAGIVQFSRSMQAEWKNTSVDMHVVSPGMMMTELLTDGLGDVKLAFIEFLCTHPELVAYHLVPRMRRAYFYQEESYIRFLTVLKVVGKLLKMRGHA